MRGFTTLSTLVALTVCAAIAIAASTSILNQLRTLTSTRLEHLGVTRTLTVAALLDGVMHDLDSTTLAIPARVHANGQIKNFDGTPNAISLRNDSLAPANDSDAITAYCLLTAQALDVEAIDADGSSLRACSRYGEYLSIDPLRTVVGLAPHAIWELRVVQKHPRRLARCVTLKLASSASMILPKSNPSDLSWIKTLVPIRRVYTLYVDRNSTLRYLGHSGETNIENQPIITQLPKLNLSFSISPDKLFSLSAIVNQQARPAYSILATSQLARRSNLFSLLARP